MAVTLAWGAWAELGVSGWTSTHSDWAIDPEPLILFTAWLGDRDPRLRDEVTDWCIQFGGYLSKTRLRTLLHQRPAIVQHAFGEFAATVAAHNKSAWPGAGLARPYTPTMRSRLPDARKPAMAWIRLRALFGIGARSEVIRCLLSARGEWQSLSRLATVSGYTKRNVSEACQLLQQAGLLAVRETGNRFDYSLARRTDLERFVGSLPSVRPDWSALLDVVAEMVGLEEAIETKSPLTMPIYVQQATRRIELDLKELDLVFLIEPGPRTSFSAATDLVRQLVTGWSRGLWPH